MIAGANLIINAIAHTLNTRTAFQSHRIFRTHAPLARQLAFAIGEDYLQPLLG
jgi:hypothetical protein